MEIYQQFLRHLNYKNKELYGRKPAIVNPIGGCWDLSFFNMVKAHFAEGS